LLRQETVDVVPRGHFYRWETSKLGISKVGRDTPSVLEDEVESGLATVGVDTVEFPDRRAKVSDIDMDGT
jgi:hypothetical protein